MTREPIPVSAEYGVTIWRFVRLWWFSIRAPHDDVMDDWPRAWGVRFSERQAVAAAECALAKIPQREANRRRLHYRLPRPKD